MQCLRDAGRRKDRLRQQRLSPRGVSVEDAFAPSSWPPDLQIAILNRLTPIWLDEHGQRRRTRPCPKCGKDSPEHRYRFEHLRMIGWAQPRQVLKIVNWCGHSQDFVAWPEADGYWALVPVLGEAT